MRLLIWKLVIPVEHLPVCSKFLCLTFTCCHVRLYPLPDCLGSHFHDSVRIIIQMIDSSDIIKKYTSPITKGSQVLRDSADLNLRVIKSSYLFNLSAILCQAASLIFDALKVLDLAVNIGRSSPYASRISCCSFPVKKWALSLFSMVSMMLWSTNQKTTRLKGHFKSLILIDNI